MFILSMLLMFILSTCMYVTHLHKKYSKLHVCIFNSVSKHVPKGWGKEQGYYHGLCFLPELSQMNSQSFRQFFIGRGGVWGQWLQMTGA